MNLTDFDLYLEYVPDDTAVRQLMMRENLPWKEAVKRDFNENWRWKSRELNLSAGCITSMFARLLGRYRNESCKKINVSCVKGPCETRVVNLDGYCEARVRLDYDAYQASNDHRKKQLALDTLMAGVRAVAGEYAWDTAPFSRVYSAIVESNYENNWYWGRPRVSPDRRRTASVYVRHEVQAVQLDLHVRDRAGEILLAREILKEKPSEWAYDAHLGKLEWVDDDRVTLLDKRGDAVADLRLDQ